MVAFVLGNGISRQTIDPAVLIQLGSVYGCNALYRTFTPSVLVATDKPIAEAIQKSGYSLTNKFYTRRPLPELGAECIPKPYWGFSSGPIAAALAALDQHLTIYLLGFDMGPTEHGTFNNVYADTEFYKTSTALPTHAGNWIKQLATIISDFNNVKFVRIHGKSTTDVADFNKMQNFEKLNTRDLVDRINNPKDL